MRFSRPYKDFGFNMLVAIPSTKLEQRFLEIFKYELFNDDEESLCNWHPEWLGRDLSLDYMKALGYTSVYYNGKDQRLTQEFEGEEYTITSIPSDLRVIIAGYRMLGKYRKVAKILKDIKRVDYYNN